MKQMVLQDYEAQLEACFSPFGDSANLDARWCTVCAERSIGSEIFWTHKMELLGDMGLAESHFSALRDGLSVSAR
jgi:hypothetical protein